MMQKSEACFLKCVVKYCKKRLAANGMSDDKGLCAAD